MGTGATGPASTPRAAPAPRRLLLLFALVSLLIYGAVVFLNVRHYGGNLSSLIQLGDSAIPTEKEPGGFGHHVVVFRHSAGYDGQTYYYVADDPFLRRRAFHSPQRYGRIGYPLLIWALTRGQRNARPVAMVAINLVAVAAVAYLAGLIVALVGRGGGMWWALAAALNPSLLIAVQKDLAEPLMMALTLAGLLLYLRRRILWAALLFAAALLTREVAVLFLLPLLAAEVWARRAWPAAALALSAGPYLAWQAVMARALGQSSATATQGQFGPPLSGIDAAVRVALHAPDHRTYWATLMVVVAFVGAALVVSAIYLWRRPDILTGGMVAHGIAALCTGPAIWLGFDNIARVYGGLYLLTVFAYVRYRRRPLTLLCGVVVLLSLLTFLRIATTSAAPYYLTP